MLPELPPELWVHILTHTPPLLHTTVCKEWSAMCAPEGSITVLVEYSGRKNDELHERAFRRLKDMALAEVGEIEKIKDNIAFSLLWCTTPPQETLNPRFGTLILHLLSVCLKLKIPRHISLSLELILDVLCAHPVVGPHLKIIFFRDKVEQMMPLLKEENMNGYSKSLVSGISRCLSQK